MLYLYVRGFLEVQGVQFDLHGSGDVQFDRLHQNPGKSISRLCAAVSKKLSRLGSIG